MNIPSLLPRTPQSRPLVIAHALGGNPRRARPEHSELTLALSIAEGADAVELDVIGYRSPASVSSEDGKTESLLVSHDVSAARQTNAKAVLAAECQRDETVSPFCHDSSKGLDYREIPQHVLSQIRRPNDGSHILTLPDLFATLVNLWATLTPPKRSNLAVTKPTAIVELKRVGWHVNNGMTFQTRRMLEVAREYENSLNIVVACFTTSVLRDMRLRLKSTLPQLRLVYDADAAKMTTKSVADVKAYAEGLAVSLAHIFRRDDAVDFVRAAHNADLAFYVFLVTPRYRFGGDFDGQLNYLVNTLHVDGLITEDVALTNAWLSTAMTKPTLNLSLADGERVHVLPASDSTLATPSSLEAALLSTALISALLCLMLMFRGIKPKR